MLSARQLPSVAWPDATRELKELPAQMELAEMAHGEVQHAEMQQTELVPALRASHASEVELQRQLDGSPTT